MTGVSVSDVSAVRDAGEGQAAEDENRVALIEPALWKRLADASDLTEFATAWLMLQSRMIPGVTRGAVAVVRDQGQIAPRVEPLAGADLATFSAVIEAAIKQKMGVVRRVDASPAERITAQLAFPVLLDTALCGVVALECVADDEAALRSAMRQLQWGVAWLRERLRVDRSADALRRAERVQTSLDLLAVALDEEGFSPACRAFVTELAIRFGCERASLGHVRRGRIHLTAISHTASFGKQMNLVRLLAEAMDEAIDQRTSLLYPPASEEPHVTRAHAELARGHGASAILTIPLFVRDRFVGALACEHSGDKRFDEDTIRALDAIAAAAAPVLEEKRLNDRWLLAKIATALADQAKRLVGPGYALRKLAVVAAIALCAFGYFARDTYRVAADAVVEGEVQRAIVATYNGFVREAPARAGDQVREGQLLALLDDRDLVLERLKWVTDRQRKTFEYERALGERNRPELRIVQAQIEQADAQIRLVDEQLARTRLVAPFDGMVVTGDLSQSVGAAVQRGQVLFEIAPLDRYRVVVEVDESQIGDVSVGRRGQLVASSLPNEAFPIAVTKITPIARAHDGRNFFRVETQVDGDSAGLRPGMRGVAKIDVDTRRIVWIWSRALVDWLRIFVWRWTG